MGKAVGELVSSPIEGMVSGRRFVKIKVRVPISEPIADRVGVTIPELGEITAYCSYEKVSRICFFCGRLGPEIATCAERAQLTEVLLKPENQGRFNNTELLKPKKGPWMVDSALIPRSKYVGGVGPNKRTFHRRDPVTRAGSIPLLSPSPSHLSQQQPDLNQQPECEFEVNHLKRARPARPNSPAFYQ